jgi:hypothetical protein
MGSLWTDIKQCVSRGDTIAICLPQAELNAVPHSVSILIDFQNEHSHRKEGNLDCGCGTYFVSFYVSPASICGLALERVVKLKGVFQRISVFTAEPLQGLLLDW